MKKIALSFLAAMGIAAAVAGDFDAVKAIVGRLAGGYNGSAVEGADTVKANAAMSQFVFVEDSSIAAGAGKVEAADGKIKISASDASGASFALGQYLRHTAKVHISWCGNHVVDYETWPRPAAATTYTPAVPVRFAYNYCTISYTMAYWSANEWREEIDRLALSGYNVALVLQGLQKAWYKTLESVKNADGNCVYSKLQIMKYVSDEAAQAWWHMGNLEGLGGPIGSDKGNYGTTEGEINAAYERFKTRADADAVLGEFIYREMIKLGVQPSIQSFVGLVPDCSNQVLGDGVYVEDGVKKTFRSASNWGIINEGNWQEYVRPDVVNPLNKAFDVMSAAWYGALVEIYKPAENGYTSYMGGDLFHEGGNKGSLTDANLADIAKKIQDTQAEYFGKNGNVVTWVIQSWQGSPYQGIRNGVYTNRALIQLLDKDMSTTGGVGANYYNNTTGEHIPWIWVEVLNFGGNTGMHGGARRFRNLPKIGTAQGHSASFMGYGILSEGLETNPMMYDMFNDAFSREVGSSSSIDTDEKMSAWIDEYLVRRYGAENVCDELKEAYTIFIKTCFDCSKYQEGCIENALCAGPTYSVINVSKWGPKTEIEYDPAELYPAARAYLAAVEKKPALKYLETFKYDFVELFLQLLGERARVINGACASSAKKRAEFLTLLDLAEKITACSPRWRLDWHEERTATVCPVDGGQSEGIRGYRRMVTSWCDGYAGGQCGLREYAHRGYSGLFKDYYKKRWEWFFQVTEGTISQAKYIQNLTELDDTFPTAVLEPTPKGGDMVKIAEEIMLVVCPPAFTWNGEAGDDVWESANWKDGGTLATTAWVDGQNAVLSGLDKTIAVTTQATVGNISFEKGAKAADDQGWLDTTTPIVLAANTTIEEAHTWDITGIMSGGWFGGRSSPATAYHKSAIADGSFTLQFQALDTSDGATWLKAVSAKIYQDGADVKIVSTGTGVVNGGALGSGPHSGGSAPATSAGYCIKEIITYRPSAVTVTGDLTVEGEVSLADGEMISLPGVTSLETVSVDSGAATLKLGDSQTLSIGLLSVGTGAKLVIKGSAPVLYSGKLTLSKADMAKAVYVGPDGVEQTLVKASDGTVKSAFTEAVVGAWIPKSVISTGLYGVTLEELATRFVITGTMDGGFVPTTKVNAYCGTLADDGSTYTVQMQTVDGGYLKVVCLEFTEVNGEIKVEAKWIRNRSGAALGTDCTDLSNSTNWGSPDVVTDTTSNGYGIYNLMLTPAVAMVNGVPYTTLADAISAANGAMITLITDLTTGAIATYPIKLEVAEGVELKVTAGDFLGWNKAWELHVKGTVSLGGNALSYGEASYAQKICLYEGGEILNTSGHGFSVFKNSTIYVKHLDGQAPALIGATLQARENITIDVEEGAKAIVETNVMDKDGQSGIDSPNIVKTGAGELVWNGYFQTEHVSLELNGGTLTRALEDNEVFTLTETSGTANITTVNPDYKVEVVAGEGNLKTYTAVPRTYLVKVTNPGETGQNGAGKLFETYGEAAAYACELQGKTPAILVIMWTVVDNRSGLNNDDTFTAALAAYNTTHSEDKTLDTITKKSPDGEQFDHELWDTTGIYKDPSTQNDILYPMNSTEWTASIKGKNDQNQDVVMTAEHTVIFNQSYGPIYINTAILPRSMKITNNATLKLGYWQNTCSLPSGMTVAVENGATAQFDNWANGWPVKVPNATINGEGSVVFGPTITGSSAVEIGTLAGTAALTLKDGVTVVVNDSIANPLKGTGTIKVKKMPATFKLADGVSHDAITFVDGTAHTALESMVMTWDGNVVTLKHQTTVAKVGDKAYGDLASAVAAAKSSRETLYLYITEDEYYRNGSVAVGDLDLSGLTVKVRLPDAREEYAIDGNFDPTKKQVTFNVIVNGPAALYDWTFDGTKETKGIVSVGRNGSTINCDGNNNYQWAASGSMKSKSHPYFGVNYGSGTPITIATFLSAGTVEDTVLVALGNTGNSLALVKAADANTVKLVAIRGGEKSDISGAILVPNAAQEHLYMIVLSADRKTVKLWIDGNLWETFSQDTPVSINDGLQVGAIYGGLAGGLKAESADEPTVKMIRVYTNELGEACALALKKDFEYKSNAGAYSRTISTATVNWREANAWKKIGSDPDEFVAEPPEDSVPVLVVDCDTVITVNTSAPMTFEAMTIRSVGDAAHTVTFKFADDTTDEGRANKLMPVMALIEPRMTVITQYAAFETLGSRVRLQDNAHLKFSYAGLDPWEVLGLTVSGQVSSAIEMGEGSTVEVVKPDMTGLNGYVDFELTEEGGAYYISVGRVPGASLEVTWDSSVTSWTAGAKGKITHNGKIYDVIIQEGDIVHFAGTNNAVDMGDGSAMPNVQLIVDAGAKVTMTGRPNTSTINGDGTVAFTEKNLDLTSANISGTATLEIAADQTVTANTLSTPVKGSGKLVVTSLPDNLKTYLQNAANWTGAIVIKNVSGVRDLDLANYGNASSKVELDGVSGFFANYEHSYAGMVVIGKDGLTITDGYSAYGVYKFAKVSGTGTISMTKSGVTHKFMIKNAADFRGSIRTSGSPFTIGTTADADKNTEAATIKVMGAAGSMMIGGGCTFADGALVLDTGSATTTDDCVAGGERALVLGANGVTITSKNASLIVKSGVVGKVVKHVGDVYSLDDPTGTTVTTGASYDYAAPSFDVANAGAAAPVTVTIRDRSGVVKFTKEGVTDDDGTLHFVCTGTEDDGKVALVPGQEYSYEVYVNGQKIASDTFFTAGLNTWFGADATGGSDVVTGGEWDGEAPAIDSEAKVYVLDGDRAFSLEEDKGEGRLAYVEHRIVFTDAIDLEDLQEVEVDANAFGAITIANNGVSDFWYAYIGGVWTELYDTEPPVPNMEYLLRVDLDRSVSPRTISYVANGHHLKDADGNTSWEVADSVVFKTVAYKGTGKLAKMEGVVPSMAVAKVGTHEHETLVAALADETYSESNPVVLLTSVLWAPATGTYYITKGAYDIKVVNEKILSWNGEGMVATVTEPTAPVEGFTAPTEEALPIKIDPTWLNAVVPGGKTIKEMQSKLDERPEEATMTRMEAYVLGVAASEVETAKVMVGSEQTSDPGTINLGLVGITPRADTGVKVKVQVLESDAPSFAEAAKGDVFEGTSATITLPSTKVKYYRLKVKFE